MAMKNVQTTRTLVGNMKERAHASRRPAHALLFCALVACGMTACPGPVRAQAAARAASSPRPGAQAGASRNQMPRTFRDCAQCPVMVVVPAGSFDMGAPPDTHHVVIRHGFALGQFEVTQAEWGAIMGDHPSRFSGASLPVDHVDWGDAQTFIRKLNRRTGKHYRLPSEAEWEYACRAGRTDDYCGGNDADGVAWYGALGEAGGNSSSTTHPVGLKAPNAFGLYDMSGNVWEWVADAWHPGYAGAPTDGSAWNGDGAKRVIRGGSWLDYPLLAQASFRIWAGATKRSSDLGFRVARDLDRRDPDRDQGGLRTQSGDARGRQRR